MSTIVIDGLNEEDFRRSIENRLREGRASAAIERLRPLLAPYAGPGGILPERFLTVEAADLVLHGWDALGDAVRRRDLPGRRVTALSIAFAWPSEEVSEPNAQGELRPHLEIGYFSDNAYPFSQSLREDLLEGYSFYGCSWSGDSEATDTALWLEGIDDLHGALASLEAQLLTSDEPDEDAIRAGSLGACLLSALLVQAVTDRIACDGLPRPLCVMAGSSGVYPYFDAPVAGMSEEASREVEAEEAKLATTDRGVPAPRYSSLLVTGIPRGKKRAVLVLDESDDELAGRLGVLRNVDYADTEAALPVTESPALIPATLGESPLLAKKPSGHAWDFRDMLSPGELEAPEAKWPPHLPADPVEPGHSAVAVETYAEPRTTLLQPALQQRLEILLAENAPPIAEEPIPVPTDPEVEAAPNWRQGRGASIRAEPETKALRQRATEWVQAKCNKALSLIMFWRR